MNSGFIRQAIPEIVSGYDVRNWDFSVIVPEASVNLLTNPSFETNLTGVNSVDSTLARVTTYQKRGAYSMQITPGPDEQGGADQAAALTANLPYTFSLDLLGHSGVEYEIYFASSGSRVSSSRTVVGTGYWQRPSIMWQPTSSANYEVVIIDKSRSNKVYYVDGWLLEQKAYPTTYFDGDSSGFVPGKNDFWWNGPAHQSTSTRSSQTRAGGREMSLNNIVTFLAIIGLGMSPVANIALPNSMGWAIYQDSFATSRDFTLAASIFGNTMLEISQKREAIINMVKPNIVSPAQPMVLRARPLMGGQPCGEAIDIVCSYKGGLEGGIASEGQERVGLQFNLYLPFISNEGDAATSLTANASISGFTNIGYRDASGVWHAMDGGVNGEVYTIADAKDGLGSVYVGGNFTQAGAVANTAYVAKWTPGVGWSSIGGVGANSYVNSIFVLRHGPSIIVYFGGNFTIIGGVAANYIAQYDGATFAALPGLSSSVLCISATSFYPTIANPSVYVGLSGGAYFARWNGTTWSFASATWTGSPLVLYYGHFMMAGGSLLGYPLEDNTKRYPILNGVTPTTVHRIGSTDISSSFTTVRSITQSTQNNIYAGTADAIWRYDGITWVNFAVASGGVGVKALTFDRNNNLFAGGEITSIGGVAINNLKMAYLKYDSNIWMPIEVVVTNTRVNAIVAMSDGNMFVGGLFGTTATVSARKTVNNTGNANASPTIQVTGPGTLYVIRNISNNKEIRFGGMSVSSGQTLTLEIDQESGITFVDAATKENMMSAIASGSDLDFFLQPGENIIEVFMTGTTAASSVVMTWKVSNWGLDGR